MAAMNAKTLQLTCPGSYTLPFGQSQQRVTATPHLMNSRAILPTIESIATGTPQHIVPQADAAQVVAHLPQLEQNRHRIEKLYRNTRIDTRHLAIDLLSDEVVVSTSQLTIQDRMEMFKETAIPLAEDVVRRAIANAKQRQESDAYLAAQSSIEDSIGLIVFVSSTGFIAPGIDAALIERLGLRRDTARVTVNFMGCAAAMNGLRVACDHVRAYPSHRALVVCLELSSINAVFDDDLNDVIIHSIFGDGCAAVVVGACEENQATGQGTVVIRDHLSELMEGTQDGITLGIRDNGITCLLSPQLPDYIEAGVAPVIEGFLKRHQMTKETIDFWAVHPGGTRIIQKAQSSLGLSDSQVSTSWEVLQQYGNMLSASVLFVMERMLQQASGDRPVRYKQAEPLTGLAFSFSPGVGLEGLLFQLI